MKRLARGHRAPDFSLRDQNGRTVRLSQYRGRRLLVYFYPKADTPGCTTQSCSVRDSREELAASGVEVVGISPDPPDAQKRFDGKHKLGFPLLSDPDHKVASAWGAWGEKSMYGRTFEGILRSAFLVDEDGKVLGAWYKVGPRDTVPKAAQLLDAD
jgi:thioredoxin-dependent peroxiredoxin